MEETSIHDLIAIWRRRKVAYLVTSAALLVVTLIFTVTWSRYQSTATVQIQQPDIPETMTAPSTQNMAQAIKAIADQRIQQIQEKITSSASLVDVITKFNLYPSDRQTKPMEAIVKVMRKKIKLEMLTEADTSGGGSSSSKSKSSDKVDTIAFTLAFSYNDPLITQQVSNELVSRFLDEDLKQRRSQAQSTTAFMDVQIKDLETTMAEQEKKIEEFRSKHPDNRPEALPLNQQLAASTFQSLQAIDANITTIGKTRGDIRAQLVTTDPYSRVVADGQVVTTPSIQLRALQAKYASEISQYSPDHPDIVKLRHQIEALQREVGQTKDTADLQSQLTDARTNLAAAVKTYGPDHPDVLALKRRVTDLESQLVQAAGDPTPHDAIKKDADNPAYLMMKQQMETADEQYNSMVQQRDALRKQYDHYMQNIAQTPAIEQEYAALSRDYDNSQLRYRELREKKMSADMNEQMEQGRKAERLTVVDPPELPVDTSPKRILLLAAGIFVSIIGGFGGVVAQEMLSRSVHGARHLSTLIGDEPLVVVPHIFTIEERQLTKKRRIQYGGAAAVSLIGAMILIDQFVMPLDVAWSVVLRRFGIA